MSFSKSLAFAIPAAEDTQESAEFFRNDEEELEEAGHDYLSRSVVLERARPECKDAATETEPQKAAPVPASPFSAFETYEVMHIRSLVN